jgi:hypothetical protein
MSHPQTRSIFSRIWLPCLLLFWGFIIYFFYSYFYLTSGRAPDWVYKTDRPFFAGWSAVSAPITQNEITYFCAGYDWSDHDVSVSAIKKDGTLIWKTAVQYRCNQININQDKIYIGQKYYHIDHEIINDFRTLVIDSKNGHITETLPFQYEAISSNNLYNTDDKNIYVHDFSGKLIKQIPLNSPKFIWSHHLKNPIMTGLFESDDGFWKINHPTDNIEPISDKGRKIFGYKSSDNFFCYLSYDAQFDIRKQNKNIDGKISCRRQDNWEKIFEVTQDPYIDCVGYYVDNESIYIQKAACQDNQGYVVTNLLSKEQNYLSQKSSAIPRLEMQGYNSIDLQGELTDPRTIIFKDKKTNQKLWDFKSTGWIDSYTETEDMVYVFDDDGKLYAFKK